MVQSNCCKAFHHLHTITHLILDAKLCTLLEPSAASQASGFVEVNEEVSVCRCYVYGVKRLLKS